LAPVRPYNWHQSLSFVFLLQAALCAMCIIQKVPELAEMFMRAVRPLLNEKKHGKVALSFNLSSLCCPVLLAFLTMAMLLNTFFGTYFYNQEQTSWIPNLQKVNFWLILLF
jgi:hypothetical protein